MLENIKEKLNENSILLENALAEYFNYSDKDYGKLIEAQKYSLLGGGKRIRAFLVMQFCRLFGGEIKAALPYACAMEMIQAYSLVHDDLPCMDNDDMRRGKPSNHIAFGENIALLAGDALLTKAFEITVKNTSCTPSTNAKAVEILAIGAGGDGMLAGQIIDTSAETQKFDFETVLRLHKLKTGKLISASAMLGCVAAGISENDERYLSAVKYAENIGLAFQIIDDILEVDEGKSELNSFITFMNVDKAKQYAIDLSNEAIQIIAPYDDGTFKDLANYLIDRKF